MTDTVIRSRIDPHIKAEAMQLFEHMGLSLSEAIRLFLYQSVAEQRIPFSINVPNATTRKALEDVEQRKDLEVTTLEALKQDWNSSACEK